ncbi:hypothetical protein VSDG_09838 [Cytospora chrysosperma]|uniref:Cytochrome P450 n=1 Tax=Cytospora chrysosperma TaxID=252740 RepID=A0A423V9I5_CYTCH|nr:hypothetical protein VSDG_09838 [Valsa sordida]
MIAVRKTTPKPILLFHDARSVSKIGKGKTRIYKSPTTLTRPMITVIVTEYVAALRDGGFTKLAGEPSGFGSRGTVDDILKLEKMPSLRISPTLEYFDAISDKHINEVRKAGRDELSLFGATKQLLAIMPDMQKVVRQSFKVFAEEKKSGTGESILPAYELNKRLLCKLNGFCFFGDELAQNDFFMSKIFEYNELVITAAEILRLLPDFMKRIIGPHIGRHTTVQDKVFDMINGVVARRLEEKKLREAGEFFSSPPNDMIQWIIDTAPAHLGWGSRRITYEIIAIWFGSVHALSATATYVIFDLLSGRRQALKDFAFSDGTLVKKGDWACVPAKAMLIEERYFPCARSFEGFRFAPRDKVPEFGIGEIVSQPEGPSRYSDLSENYHAWGIGGIVCPGRFYAAVATKLIMAHILKHFDCSFVEHNVETSRSWRSYVLPREDVLVRFTARK